MIDFSQNLKLKFGDLSKNSMFLRTHENIPDFKITLLFPFPKHFSVSACPLVIFRSPAFLSVKNSHIYNIFWYLIMDIALGLIEKGIAKNLKVELKQEKKTGPGGKDMKKIQRKIEKETQKAKIATNRLDRSIEAFFIGPRGENMEFFKYLIDKAIDSHHAARVEYQIEDARHITRKMKIQPAFLDAQDRLERALNQILTKQKDLTPPFFSSRYFGHMIWETTIPGLVGNFATLLYNPNNCAYEASPYTTLLEIDVMKEFAIMFRYPSFLSQDANPQEPHSWGHLTCGGTIANNEAMWAARNCRFLPLTLRKYVQWLENPSEEVKGVTVPLATGERKTLLSLSSWELLNIPNDDALTLFNDLFKLAYPEADLPSDEDQRQRQIEKNYAEYQNNLGPFTIGKAGIPDMYNWLQDINEETPDELWPKGRVPKPKVFVSATVHYSIAKSLSILGFGEKAVEKIPVNLDTRLCVNHLRERLQWALDNHVPVLAVTGIVGTTEESTVDPLDEIVKIRDEFAAKGLYFHFHIDGAYGGYFVSMTCKKDASHWNSISQYVDRQLLTFNKADSITFDPHKTGYVPYACGGIIYRNHRLRDNLSFSAPYIYTGAQPNMAIYGIEGSKPGSSVTSVYLSLQVLPLVRAGHGELLERTMMNTKIFVASLYRIPEIKVTYPYIKNDKQVTLHEKFQCLMLSRYWYQKTGNQELKAQQIQAIKLISETNPIDMEKIVKDNQLQDFYLNLGPDMNIPCYGLNFSKDGARNTSLKLYNQFNKELIRLSKPVGTDVSVRLKELFVSETEISRTTYGEAIFNDFITRHGLTDDGEDHIVVIRSTIMNAFFTELKPGHNVCESSNRVFIEELLENACETLLALQWR